MLDKLLKLNSIHEVRKALKANDIVGDQVSELESEWLAAKELVAVETVVTTTIVEEAAVLEVTEELSAPAVEETLEESSTPTVANSFRARKFSK
jgi:hypothetical protein